MVMPHGGVWIIETSGNLATLLSNRGPEGSVLCRQMAARKRRACVRCG